MSFCAPCASASEISWHLVLYFFSQQQRCIGGGNSALPCSYLILFSIQVLEQEVQRLLCVPGEFEVYSVIGYPQWAQRGPNKSFGVNLCSAAERFPKHPPHQSDARTHTERARAPGWTREGERVECPRAASESRRRTLTHTCLFNTNLPNKRWRADKQPTQVCFKKQNLKCGGSDLQVWVLWLWASEHESQIKNAKVIFLITVLKRWHHMHRGHLKGSLWSSWKLSCYIRNKVQRAKQLSSSE